MEHNKGKRTVTDLQTDSPTDAGASQTPIASTSINPIRNQKKKNDESDKEGDRPYSSTYRHERIDCHNFRGLYTGISRMEGGGVPRIDRIRKDRHGGKSQRRSGV